jgi:asparagine synthase (glutamine-hydrolysing)
MSHIFGMLTTNSKPLSISILEQMLKGLPQHHHFTFQNNVTAHCVCAYYGDLNHYFETQSTMMVEDEHWICVGDVQLYNRKELCDILNIVEKNVTDIEIVFEMFKLKHHQSAFEMHGDFAYVVMSKKSQEVYMFRDHAGVKPLYYYHDKQNFVFSSDPRAILALPWVNIELNTQQIMYALTFSIGNKPEQTYFKHIKSCLAASFIHWNKKEVKVQRYWRPGRKKIKHQNPEFIEQQLRNLIEQAVKRRLPSHKFACELSGGLDSSVVSVLSSRLKASVDIPLMYGWAPSFDLFSPVQEDERDLMLSVAQQERADLRLMNHPVDWKDSLFSRHPRVGEWVYYHYLSAQSEGVKYIISGWGGDQASSYRATPFALWVQGEWGSFFREIKFLANHSIKRYIKLLFGYTVISWFDPTLLGSQTMVKEHYGRIKINGLLRKKDLVWLPINPIKHFESGDIQTRTHYADKLANEFHVKQLYPLIDKDVVDYALSIPRALFIHQGYPRFIFRKAFQSILPQKISRLTNKDDPAKSAYIHATIKQRIEVLNEEVAWINQLIFNDIVDFERIQHDLSIIQNQTDFYLYVKILYSIKPLIEIQSMLEDSDRY